MCKNIPQYFNGVVGRMIAASTGSACAESLMPSGKPQRQTCRPTVIAQRRLPPSRCDAAKMGSHAVLFILQKI